MSGPLVQAKRIGYATFGTRELERQIAHYQEVVGLEVAAREPDRAVLTTNTGLLSVVLQKASDRACSGLAFEVASEPSLSEIARRLSAAGLRCEERSDTLPGVGRLLRFSDPKGTTIELFQDWGFLEGGAAVKGAATFKLGHVAFAVPDPAAMAEFYGRTLGFRVSDWIGDYFVFLRCGADHHTVNFIRGERPRMHHIAFELRDTAALHAACDLVGRKQIPIIWGPVRHGPGHNIAIYHRNPDDQMVELFTELDRMLDEERGYFEPRPWHRDRPQRPKVWDPAKQRDMWGQPPGPDFFRASEP